MQQSFIFGGNTGLSYDQIQKQRDIANELLRANMSTPQNVGEGLSAIGRALAAKAIDKRTSRADEANRQAYQARRSELFGALGGGAAGDVGGSAPYSPPSQPPVVFDPNSPQGVASDTMAALGKSVYTPGDRDSFVAAMMPHALRVSEMTGLDPRLVIAQAAQETGWGKSSPNNNYFGIKSHGKGGGANLGTFEYVDGNRVNVNDSFRTYGGMGESAEDYARFLMENPRYKDMLAAGDLESQLAALGRSGYATDPNYAASVGSIANSIQIPGMAPAQPASVGGGSAPAGMPNPAILMALAETAGSPYASESDKMIAQILMDQTIQAMDPVRQLELEKARMEVDQMRNPQPQERTRIVSGEEAATLGLDPSKSYNVTEGPNGLEASAIGGGGTTIVNDLVGEPAQFLYGTDAGLPAGWRLDTRNGVASVIPGGPADVEAASAADKGDRKDAQGRLKLGTTLESLSLNINDIEDGGLPVTGVLGDARRTWLGRALTGDGAVDFGNRTAQITDSAALAEVQNMRDNSPTGGAVGSLTDDERRAIGNAVTGINNSTSAEEYVRAAKAFRKLALDLAYGEGAWEMGDDGQPRLAGQAVEPSANDAGFAEFAADPSAAAAAAKYGVTLEEMWAIKQGMQ